MPDLAELENRLWDAADELRANSGLKASEYGTPVLGLIFLRFADAKFSAARDAIEAKGSARRTSFGRSTAPTAISPTSRSSSWRTSSGSTAGRSPSSPRARTSCSPTGSQTAPTPTSRASAA